MGSFAQENKRALVMLAVAGALLIALLGMRLLSGGSEQTQADPVPQATPTVQPVDESIDEQTAVDVGVSNVAAGQTDPFAALAGTEEDSAVSSEPSSKDSSTSKDSTGKAAAKSSFTGTQKPSQRATDGSDSKPPKDASTKEPTKQKAPVPVKPQLIDEGTSEPGSGKQSGLQVHLISVTDDTAVVKVDGTRITLYMSVPDASGVTYVSQLSGGCAWLSGADTAARVSVCEGETASL